MKRIQGSNLVGYVTLHVQGINPESLFQVCAYEKIPVWNVKKINATYCTGNVYLHHLKRVKSLDIYDKYDIQIKDRKGYFNYLLQMWTRKEIILSIVLCSVIIFILSNIVWKVNITGVSTDVERKISEQLSAYGLYEGAWAYSLETLDVVQQDVLHAVPELLYIGIQKKGTTYHVDGLEKRIVKEKDATPTQHLIATKNGIIQKVFVKEGLPLVEVNDFVKKGDRLVSGVISELDNQEDDKEGIKEQVAAEGEIYANTWYEVSVNSSLHRQYEKLSGEKVVKYELDLGYIQIPIWGFTKVPFENTFIEKVNKPLYVLKWKTPIQLMQQNIYDKDDFKEKRTNDEAKKNAIKHVQKDLQLKLGTDAQILKYYVLHESVENGKVKLDLYVSVLENIAKGEPIH